jgi:hypothetical protein
VFKSRVLRNIFGSQNEAITIDWNKSLAVELHSLFSSLNILTITSRRALAHVGGKEVHQEFCLESLKKRNHLEGVEVDGRMLLK